MNDSLGALLAIAVLWLVFKFAFGGRGGNRSAGPSIIGVRQRAVPQAMVDSVQSMFPQISEAAIRYDLSRSGSAEATCDRILREGSLPPPPSSFFSAPGGPGTGRGPPAIPSAQQQAQAQAQRGTAAIPSRSASASGGSGTSTPRPRTGATGAGKSTSSSSKRPTDLISRYGLASRISSGASNSSSTGGLGDESTGSMWSAGGSGNWKGKGREMDSGTAAADTSIGSITSISSSNASGGGAGGGWSESREEREARLRARKEEMILEARRRLEAKQASPAHR